MLQTIKAGSTEIVPKEVADGRKPPGCGPDTPLNTALARGNEEIIRLLLDDGRFAFNMSSLDITSAAGYDDLVKIVLVISYPTRTANPDAIRGGHMRTLKILVQDGRLDPNQPDKIGWAALHYAAYYGMIDMLQFLLGVECIRPGVRSDDRLGGNHTPFSEAAKRGDIKRRRRVTSKKN
ncbi:ankyrin repeat protein [Penicillium herquei]|nr:ankyrin repeat protein [Penicillium herquei]